MTVSETTLSAKYAYAIASNADGPASSRFGDFNSVNAFAERTTNGGTRMVVGGLVSARKSQRGQLLVSASRRSNPVVWCFHWSDHQNHRIAQSSLLLHVFFERPWSDFGTVDIARVIRSHTLGGASVRRIGRGIGDERDHFAVFHAADADTVFPPQVVS